ncbi:MAG: hypothetical protein P4L91_05920 [Burkholderiaceae bacterium]|nr:hypothetical protein [Burkholderiaceae bacterium]
MNPDFKSARFSVCKPGQSGPIGGLDGSAGGRFVSCEINADQFDLDQFDSDQRIWALQVLSYRIVVENRGDHLWKKS